MRNVKCDDSNASENIHHKLHKQLDKFVSSNQIRSVLQRKMWLQHGISNSNENELLSGFLSSCFDETFSMKRNISNARVKLLFCSLKRLFRHVPVAVAAISESDWHLTSPYNFTPESHIKVMRIKEMITNDRNLDC